MGSVRAHDFRGVSTSVDFHRNWSVSAVLDATTWSSRSGFPSFYLRDLHMSYCRVFAHWVHSWLRVRGSRSPPLFLFCYGGGGGSMSPLSPLLRCSKACFQLLVVVACPSSSCAGLGVSRFDVVFLHFYCLFSLCILFICIMRVPALNGPVGLCFWTRDMTSDWLPTGLPPRIPGHCRLVLTGSHNSLFLRYPAIDIVWLGPVFLTLGSLSHLALRDSALWSLSHGRCGLQSLSWTLGLPLLTLTHDLTLQYSTPW